MIVKSIPTKGFVMGISSLGVGSSILTQDVLDQLRKADEATLIRPVTLNIANENDKKAAFDVLDATMKNLSDAIGELKNATLFDSRSVDVSGTSVNITASANSDVQDFTLDVTRLATKEIDESGAFGADTDKIATADGSMNLDIKDAAGNVTKSYTINYTANMTLKDLKNQINKVAGNDVSASLVNIANGDTRLFLNAVNEGENQNFVISDTSGNLSDDGGTTAGGTNLTSGMSTLQDGLNAQFTFNGQSIERESNNITDLVTGYDITLKELGSSDVSVQQNRDEIMKRIDSFVEKYNAAITELGKVTKSSTDSSVRGIFSGDSTMRGMLSTVQNMIGSVGGSVGTLYDYGFDVDKDGKLSVDKSVMESKLDDNAANVEAFFVGGDYVNADGSTTTLTGAFSDMSTTLGAYTDYNGMLDQFQTSISDRISDLEDNKQSITARLDDKYETLKKQYAAYDAMIAKLNNASNMFIQMANTQNAAQKQ